MTALFRAGGGVAAAAAVVAVGIWAGRGQPAKAAALPPGRATDELAYAGPSHGEIPVGDAMEVNGQPMQLSIFYTDDAPEIVARFYAEAFRARRAMPIVAVDRAVTHVSAFDPRDGLQRFVNALPQSDGSTLVTIGVLDPRRPLRLSQEPGASSIPVPVEHRGFVSHRARDAGPASEAAQYVSRLTAPEILAFYRRELSARGFLERTEESSASVAVFTKGAGAMSVAVQSLSDDRGSAVFVHQSSGGM